MCGTGTASNSCDPNVSVSSFPRCTSQNTSGNKTHDIGWKH